MMHLISGQVGHITNDNLKLNCLSLLERGSETFNAEYFKQFK